MKTPEEIVADVLERLHEVNHANAVDVMTALDAAGYVIVPKEPTDRMCESVDTLPAEWPAIRGDYRNMVAAFQTQKGQLPGQG